MKPRFTNYQIRHALRDFCRANPSALRHYLTFSLAAKHQAALNSSQVPKEFSDEYAAEFQTAVMEWLDDDDDP